MSNIRINEYLLKEIYGFEKYCREFLSIYFDEKDQIDIDEFDILFHLVKYIKQYYIDDNYNIVGNVKELDNIIQKIYFLYDLLDEKRKEIVLLVFVEGMIYRRNNYKLECKNILKYDIFKNRVDSVILFWDNVSKNLKTFKEIKFLNGPRFGIYLFIKIIGFRDYFYLNYDDEDLLNRFTVVGVINGYIKNKYINEDYIVIGDKKELEVIMNLFNEFIKYGDDGLKEIVITGFLEGLITSNNDLVNNLKKILKYKGLQNKLDELIEFWY